MLQHDYFLKKIIFSHRPLKCSLLEKLCANIKSLDVYKKSFKMLDILKDYFDVFSLYIYMQLGAKTPPYHFFLSLVSAKKIKIVILL
jgi:hypothetical protein